MSFLMVLEMFLVYFLSEGREAVMSSVSETKQLGYALLNIWHFVVMGYPYCQYIGIGRVLI